MPVNLRFLFAGLLTASFACVISLGGAQFKPRAASRSRREGQEGEGEREGEAGRKPPEEDNIPFTFPYDRGRQEQLQAARDYLDFKDVPWNTVGPLLQNILESQERFVLQHVSMVGDEKKINRISVKTEANRIIAAFPKEGLEFYQQSYGATGSALLDEAIKANYDLIMLADVSQKFFHTKAGAEATVLLGSLYLERGNYLEAAYAFERFLARPNIDDLLTPRTLFKACVAFKRSGDPRHAELAQGDTGEAESRHREGRPDHRPADLHYEQLRAEIDRPLELLRAEHDRRRMGDASAARRRGPRPSTAARRSSIPSSAPRYFPANTEDDVEGQRLDQATNSNTCSPATASATDLPLARLLPDHDARHGDLPRLQRRVRRRDARSGGRTAAIVRAGDLRWVSKTNFGLHQMLTQGTPDDIDMYRSTRHEWCSTYKQTGRQHPLREPADRLALPRRAERLLRGRRRHSRRRRCYYEPEHGHVTPGQEYRAERRTGRRRFAPAGSSRSISDRQREVGTRAREVHAE